MTGENNFATFVPNVPSKRLKMAAAFHNPRCLILAAQQLGRPTFDQAVAGSTPGLDVIKSPRSTQPSIPPG